jgi:hypothetical protein
MSWINLPAYAANVICFFSVAIYAQRRLNTPVTNRSSTRRRLYREAVLGYVVCTLILFVVLSVALRSQPMQSFLLLPLGGVSLSKDVLNTLMGLPPPLIATIVLTTLLPNVPYVRDVDSWLLEWFKAGANIPREVSDRAERLVPERFQVGDGDLPRLKTLIGEEGLPEVLLDHLHSEPGSGLQISQYRFTRVAKLFAKTEELAGNPRCRRTFFRDYDRELQTARADFRDYCSTAASGLEQARQLREKVSASEYEVAMRDRREQFAELSSQRFSQLALLVTGAVLSLDDTDQEIGDHLRAIGFAIEDQPEEPEFPLRSLAGLTVFLLLYLLVTNAVMQAGLHPPVQASFRSPIPPGARPFFFVLSYMCTIAATVWFIQRHPELQRLPGSPARWDIYAICALLGAFMVGAVWLLLFFLRYRDLPSTITELNMTFGITALVGSLCGAVAYFADTELGDYPTPVRRRLIEALGCTAFMVFIAALLLLEAPPPPLDANHPYLSVALMIFLPASVSFIIGYFVPHICRTQRYLSRLRAAQVPPETARVSAAAA